MTLRIPAPAQFGAMALCLTSLAAVPAWAAPEGTRANPPHIVLAQGSDFPEEFGPAPAVTPPPPPVAAPKPPKPKPPRSQSRARTSPGPEGVPEIRRGVPDAVPSAARSDPAQPAGELSAPSAPSGVAPQAFGVILGGLDKIAARTAKFEVELEKPVEYNTLIITAHTCRTRPPEDPPESAAFLDVEERKPDGTRAKLFSGWMFASSPALNALEHPIYDVWVVSCKTTKPDVAAPAGPNS